MSEQNSQAMTTLPRGNRKPIPRCIVVFGASGHIGRPLAEHLRYKAPDVKLRLVSSDAVKRADLQQAFPQAECVKADLLDAASLEPALAGAEGVFIVTPAPFDEATAMKNFIEVARRVARPVHVVRIVGFEPESSPRRVPETLRRYGGTAQQHYVAKRLLDESDLPVTYLNIGATYMDNLLLAAPTIRAKGMLIWPQRVIPFLDPRDLGEIGANLLLSPDERHLHQFLTLNNGQDLLSVEEVAQMLSDVLKVEIGRDPSRQGFIDAYGAQLARRRGRPDAAAQTLDFLEYEQGNSAFQSLNDAAERILGRKPTSLRSWLMEHRAKFLP